MAGHETHSNTGYMKCNLSHYAIESLGVKPSSSWWAKLANWNRKCTVRL